MREPTDDGSLEVEDEYLMGALLGAPWVPLGSLLDGSGLAELPSDRRIIAYCAIGARSRIGRDLLRDAGWSDVAHLGGGGGASRHGEKQAGRSLLTTVSAPP